MLDKLLGIDFGIFKVDYTPDGQHPPDPLGLPLFFTEATLQLAFVQCDKVTAPNLTMGFM